MRYLIKSGSDNNFNLKNKIHEEFFFCVWGRTYCVRIDEYVYYKKSRISQHATNKLIIADPCYYDSKVKPGPVNNFKTKKDKYDVFELKYGDKVISNFILYHTVNQTKICVMIKKRKNSIFLLMLE